MTRFLVPALLVVLLAAQAAYLWPAYKRSQVRIVEAVFEKPRLNDYRGLTEVLGVPAMAQVLHEAEQARAGTEAASKPVFEETPALLVARFPLVDGDARAIAVEFSQRIAVLADDTLAKAAAADAKLRGVAQRRNKATPPPFVLASVNESRPPWLRPLDFVAAAVNLAALVLWWRRRRSVGESQG